MTKPPKTIDQYLAPLGPEKQALLRAMRKAIQEVAPEAVECIAYGIPGFRLEGRHLVGFGAGANHCALYPGPEAIEALEKDLAGYSTSKGTVRFPLDCRLPVGVVKKLVRARLAAAK